MWDALPKMWPTRSSGTGLSTSHTSRFEARVSMITALADGSELSKVARVGGEVISRLSVADAVDTMIKP